MQISHAATTQPVVAAFLHAFSIGGRANTQKLKNGHARAHADDILACVCVCVRVKGERKPQERHGRARRTDGIRTLHGTSVGN